MVLLAGCHASAAPPGLGSPPRYLIGALQTDGRHLIQEHAAGLRVAVLELGWNRFEPEQGKVDQRYVDELLRKLTEYRRAGFQVMLDFGFQYPPAWVFRLPHSRYRNQFGDEFTGGLGDNGVNAVFSQALRDRQAAHVEQVFQTLGTDFAFVRLGWMKYGELQFPVPQFNGHPNSYWAFDDLAQGKAPGLPAGIMPCPEPGWIPGTASEGHLKAARFLHWCLDALGNYHDWQIATVRQHYHGKLCMLYPSWGIRPGWINDAIRGDLDGSTSPERNGEIQRGYDFERFIGGIRDPDVVVYCTWLDARRTAEEEAGADPTRWSPVHWLASLAQANPLKLAVYGENTGGGDLSNLEVTVQRMKDYHLLGFLWAFERDLFDGKPPELADVIRLAGGT